MEPQIILGGMDGINHGKAKREALKAGQAYRDLSTVCVVPTRGVVPARVVESWMNLMTPMNQPFVRMFVEGMEVGAAYETAVETILAHPNLRSFRYMLTLEEDNIPPPDGLLRLYESVCTCRNLCQDHYSVVAGLYYTKGLGGQPMIYGDPRKVLAFNPQLPKINHVQECNGTGMGFTLFDMRLFKRLAKPWFRTVQETGRQGTQDLVFMGEVRRRGFRIASDNRVRVGHYDSETRTLW